MVCHLSPAQGDPAQMTVGDIGHRGETVAQAQLEGVTLSYEVHGSGEPVVLVCGTGQASFTWDLHQVPALTAARYQVVTFDNRGMPPSDSPPPPYDVDDMKGDLVGLIEHLGIGPCRVAGYSLGAFTTQELALSRPDLVRGAALIGTIGRQDTFRRALFESWVDLDQSRIELPVLFETISAAFSLFSPGALDDDENMAQFIQMAVTAPPWRGPGKLGQHQADLSYDGRLEALRAVEVPCLVIGFELDMITPPRLAKEVARSIPACRYVEIAGSGHYGILEKPGEVNSALLNFFSGV
jgi:pimeloyl-ACP methyl ester carboxylesterase